VIQRILLALDDSPDSLAAARLAVELAGRLGARVRAVHVSADHVLDAALEAMGGTPGVAGRRSASDVAILARVSAMAGAAGVSIETVLLTGGVGPAVLDAVRSWEADLVILGKSARSATGEPYVGTQTRHILEFSQRPVLVVPPVR
jgi:nucleotide-binding universal stress UspA family protein